MVATTVSTGEDLEQILKLQKLNLASSLDHEEIEKEGFVTLVHSLGTLAQMNAISPSVIIKDGPEVVGYALVMTLESKNMVPTLDPMFENLEKLFYRDRPLLSYTFYIIGQVCVAKAHRGKGIFEMLYNKHKELFEDRYDLVVTEISTRNHRSLRAHQKIGFNTISIYRDILDEWAVVAWDWT